jgi:hypothetical protein
LLDEMEALLHGRNTYVDSNPKCWLFLKIDLQRDFAAGVYLSKAPLPS